MLSGKGLPILEIPVPNQASKKIKIKRTNNILAKIASTRLEPRTVMVAPPVHPSMRPTARPPKRARKIQQQLLPVPAKLVLELREQRVRVFECAVSPSGGVALEVGRPGDELQVAFVEVIVAAAAVLVVPLARDTAEAPVLSPIGELALPP
jgi:hypothetical protein